MASLLSASVVRVGLEASSRDDAIRALVRDLRAAGAIAAEDEPYRKILDREALQSTAIGAGIALPHARCASCLEPRFAVARLAAAVDFHAPDSIPVDLIFLLVGPPEAPAEHVRLLGRIARMLEKKDIPAALRAAKDAASLRLLLEREI